MRDARREELRARLAEDGPLLRQELELMSDDTLEALGNEYPAASANAARHNGGAVVPRGQRRRDAHEFGAVTVRNKRTREAALQAREHHDLRPGTKRTG